MTTNDYLTAMQARVTAHADREAEKVAEAAAAKAKALDEARRYAAALDAAAPGAGVRFWPVAGLVSCDERPQSMSVNGAMTETPQG